MDPGFPEATRLAAEIQSCLRQISVQADLDAIRIYLESGNWPRALSLLDDLLPNADPIHEPLIRFLIAASATLHSLEITPPPAGFLQALDLLFGGEAQRAGRRCHRAGGACQRAPGAVVAGRALACTCPMSHYCARICSSCTMTSGRTGGGQRTGAHRRHRSGARPRPVPRLVCCINAARPPPGWLT